MSAFISLAIWPGVELSDHLRLLAVGTLGLSDTAAQEFVSVASLSLQVAVAGYALWLNRVFGTNRAGWALCGAFLLMLVMHINEAFSPPVTVSALGLRPELAYAFISFLLLLGLSHLASLYRERLVAENAIRQARDGLEKRVQERTAELARANQSLAASEERFSKAFHASPIPSGIQSLPHRRFVDVNERLVTLTGCSREDLLGQTPDGLFIWEQPALVDQWFERLARNEEVEEEATRVRTPSGALRDVLVSLSPITIGGQEHALLLAQDTSERLLLERQLCQAQKMEGIGQLAAGVAHDFNNILTVIQGHSALVQSNLGEQDPSSKSIAEVLKAADRATTLIRQLLMFSRKQVMRFRTIDLNESLSSCLAMIDRLLGEHIEVKFCPGPELPAILADNNMMEQVVMNLAVNARDAMPNGGQVTITTAVVPIQRPATPIDSEARNGRFVCVTFTDTGCGMDAHVLSHIFEPFFTTKGVGKGTGLGLATVFGIVRQHHGWLDVESQPGHGTTFRVYFPATDQLPQTQEPECDVACRQGRETILVAEDEDALREMVAEILTLHGYKVYTARSGRQALEVWQQAHGAVDLLVTDMVMPEGILGGELAERLLAQSPALKVIYTSGYSPGMAGKDVSLTEGHNFLPKPYSLGKLAQFIRQSLDAPSLSN